MTMAPAQIAVAGARTAGDRLPFAVTAGAGLQYVLAALSTAIATLLCWWLDAHMSVAGLAMVYLLAVIAAAALLSRSAGVATSLLCVTALNYFFVPPRYSFEVDGAEYWWTLAVLLGTSLGLNALIAGLRAREAIAAAGMARTSRLHQLGEALASCESHEAMAQRAAQWFADTFGVPCAVLVRSAAGEHTWFCAGAAWEPVRQAAEWAIEHGRPLGRGCPDWPDLPLWCMPFSRRNAMGAVQMQVGRNVRPSPEELGHWEALVRQAGLAVERERAAALAQEASALARAEATRNTLLASLSHDLRTPLAAIVGTASALRAHGESMGLAERAGLLANVENEARDMTLMADNILQMARLSQPLTRLAAQWESVEEVLGTAVQRMRRRWAGARIECRVPSGLPPVQAEAGLIAQVVANLVDNALRHSGEQSEVVVQAGRSRHGVFVAVRDHGPGMPQGDAVRLFEAFHRGVSPGGGAGLGLAICRTIVQAHGGEIGAKDCAPGLEVRFDLPVPASHDTGR